MFSGSCLAGTVPGQAPEAAREPIPPGEADRIVLNEWAADELQASAGDRIELDYFLWDPAAGLTTHTAAFTVDNSGCRVPIEGFAADRRLAPEYPGITGATSLANWDPPFPVDLSRIRPQDEKYWNDYRTTPKAFIAFERGRELWKTRYGSATSIRMQVPTRGRCGRVCRSDRRGSAPVTAAAGDGDHDLSGAASRDRGLVGRDRLRRVLHLLQLLPRRVRAAARRPVLPPRRRAAPAADRHPARRRLHDRARAPPAADRGARSGNRGQRARRARRHRIWPADRLRPAHVVAGRRRDDAAGVARVGPVARDWGGRGDCRRRDLRGGVAARRRAIVAPRAPDGAGHRSASRRRARCTARGK